MPVNVPLLNQFYPSIPLKELTNLYSVGDNAFPPTGTQTHRVAILSYLPKTLMIHEDLQFNNKYVLLVEAQASVTSINWAAQLYLNGVQKPAGTFLTTDASNPFEFNINFRESIVDAAGLPIFDRLKITCTVVSGGQTKLLQLDHNFAKATNVTGLITAIQSVAFAGDPHTFNFMANQLKEYFPGEILQWNGQSIEANADRNENLLFIVLGMMYFNIMGSAAMTQPTKSFEWLNFTRTELIKAINANTAYVGNFRIGLGMIPLNVLSDALDDVNAVPEFTNIDDDNEIYKQLHSFPPAPFNWADPSPFDPQHVAQSKTRLMGNRNRLIALYHYAMFPKSAIKMIGILVKFLFEVSRKNYFNECYERTDEFMNVNLGNHKKTPDVIRNILTHYFRDPYNKIEQFPTEALRVANLGMSPYTYSLVHNIAPRILKAYFAKRVVKKINDDFFELNFERNDNLQFRNAAGNWVYENNSQRLDPANNPIPKPNWDNFLGRETFLIVETWNCKGKTVRCNISSQPNPFAVSMTGGNLQVELNGGFVYDIERNFEDYSALNKADNSLPGNNAALVTEYLYMNHGNKFIARVHLRPDTLAHFETWTNNLAGNTANFSIKAKLTDDTKCFFGNDVQQTYASGTFLDADDKYNNQLRYRVLNRLVYESHNESDIFNTIGTGTGNYIGRIPNRFVQDIANNNTAMLPFRKAVYFYFDELGHEHFICDLELLKPRKRRDGVRVYRRTDIGATDAIVNAFLNVYPSNGDMLYRRNPTNTFVVKNSTATPPVQPMADVANNVGESRWKYYCSHDNTTTFTADRMDEYDQIVVRGTNNNAVVSFQLNVDNPAELRVEIVHMLDELRYAFTVGTANKLIRYTFSNTQRRYANPGCFAAFIGILAKLGYNDMVTTGMCFDDATSYPSVSHPNGDSIDTAHRTTATQRFDTVAAFRDWGFSQIISGDQPQYLTDGADQHQADHNNHLHSGNFLTPNNVTDLVV